MLPDWNFLDYAEHSPTSLAVVDDAGRVVYANQAFSKEFAARGTEDSGNFEPGTSRLPASLEAALIQPLDRALHQAEEQRFVWEAEWDAAPRARWCRIIPGNEERQAILELSAPPGLEWLERALRAERFARRRPATFQTRWQELFFNVIEELPVFVYLQRRDYSVAYANRKTKNFYGETDGRLCYEVFGGRDSPCPSCPTFRVFDTGRPEVWQFTDSEGRIFHIYDYPFADENGEPLVMELGIEVTELKRVEKELFQAHKMRAVGVLAGGIAHDLNNNLVPIIFNLDYALGRSQDPGLAAPLREALRAAYRAADLVEQVLEYSRQQSVSCQPLSLIPQVQENLELLHASMPENITLEVDSNAEHDTILSNPAQVQQVLLNLCRNAVQAMPGGGRLTVRIGNAAVDTTRRSIFPTLTTGDYVIMQVADTGQGIEPDMRERIFEPFYTSKKNRGGTGMGLAVVHAIVTSHGGAIHVDSTPGVGSTFSVYFPAVEAVETPLTAEPCVIQGETGRLLLVDDDLGPLQAMERVLREAGFEVGTADCGEEGLREYRRGGYDLVIADLSMPDMDGLDMAGRILAQDAAAKILICTGHVEPKLEQRIIAAGVTGFILKPMTPRALVESVRRHCR